MSRTLLTRAVAAGCVALLGAGAAASAAPLRPHAHQQATQQEVEQEKVTAGGAEHSRPGVRAARHGATRCSNYWAERYGKNLLGKKMYNYRLTVHWCWRRGRITSATYNTIPETRGLFWKYFGKDEKVKRSGGKRRSFYRVYAQGHFAVCGPVAIGCIQDKYPWVQVVVRGNGAVDYKSGG